MLRDSPRVAASDAQEWRRLPFQLDGDGSAYSILRATVQENRDQALAELETLARRSRGGQDSQLRLRAAALLLRDLIALGWDVRSDAHWISVRPSATHEVNKAATKRGLEFGRQDQLQEPATRKFIMALERPSRFSNSLPVTELIADGRRLARQLDSLRPLSLDERVTALQNICQPYRQLVDSESRDTYSNIKLSDIWRYFRHSWSTRYRTTPGRNLFYLIRDAAQPNHPIMGITALGNSILQLGCRDAELGWTIKSLLRSVASGELDEHELLDSLRARLTEDIDLIYRADLPFNGSLRGPIPPELLDRLRVIESDSANERTRVLRDQHNNGNGPSRRDSPELTNLEESAKTPLFRAKRARALRELLQAYQELSSTASLFHSAYTEAGSWAINQAIRQLKKHFAATAIMELTVCGAVQPYNLLLGGKLACLLMTSAGVVRDYEQRYEDGSSIIASQMAGRPVRKKPQLVYLGTTSLYSKTSSQYNRVSIPLGTFPDQRGLIRFKKLGISEGYGSPNLSSETEAALERLTSSGREYRNVNFVFGEGQSPKMRQLRDGLSALGLGESNLLNHGSRRLVYGASLVNNLRRFLTGVDKTPDYCVNNNSEDGPIIEHWRRRWLAMRLDHVPTFEALATSTPLTERVSRLIAPAVTAQLNMFARNREEEPIHMPEVVREDEKIAFIRHLYRDESAYSDNVKLNRLRELNVKTSLDDVVRRVIKSGGSVVITGNAGDGKTHTIRLLEAELKSANARYIIDASEHPQQYVLDQWLLARHEQQPFCIAINEGPLVELIRAYRAEHPWLEEIRQQLLSVVRLVPVEEVTETERYAPRSGETVVIDLSHRRVLSQEIIKRVLDKLTDDIWYAGCVSCPGNCPVVYNRRMLRHQRVQERLIALLRRVAERGVRATFRELLAYVSYLIFGGRTCADLLQDPLSEQSRYYWHAFEGQGALFESLEVGLDPLRQTDARVDEELWRGGYTTSDFAGEDFLPITVRDLDELQDQKPDDARDSFIALKRRWYFEHPQGQLGHSTDADRFFGELHDPSLSTQLRVGRLIALINSWWNPSDRDQQEKLRLWTRLSYSPRAEGKAMVAGREVQNLRLKLFRPQLSGASVAAFGLQSTDYLVLAPPENLRFSSLVVDRRLVMLLLTGGVSAQALELGRRLTQFNDSLAQHAEVGSHVRTIELLDPAIDLMVKVRVDLNQRRYDSAQ